MGLENLRKLYLFNCEVTNIPQFRERLFQGLPNLKYLDGIDREGNEDESNYNPIWSWYSEFKIIYISIKVGDEEDDEIDEEEEEENDEFIVKDDGKIPDEFYEDDEEEEYGDEDGEVEVEELEVDRGKDEKGRIEETMEM